MRSLDHRRLAIAAVIALAAGSCSDGPTAPARPEPGSFVLSLTTPNANDQAAVFRLVLPAGMTTGIPELSADGIEVFHRRSADTLRVAVFGSLASGELLRIAVPDLRQLPLVSVTLLEVAADDDTLRESLGGYAVSVGRP